MFHMPDPLFSILFSFMFSFHSHVIRIPKRDMLPFPKLVYWANGK